MSLEWAHEKIAQFKFRELKRQVLPILEPPCKNCRSWQPHPKYDANGNVAGFRMCTAIEIKNDFSCFEVAPVPPAPPVSGYVSTAASIIAKHLSAIKNLCPTEATGLGALKEDRRIPVRMKDPDSDVTWEFSIRRVPEVEIKGQMNVGKKSCRCYSLKEEDLTYPDDDKRCVLDMGHKEDHRYE